MTYQLALRWSAIWVVSALLFSVGVYHFQGINAASTFLTAYVVEKMLSFDNLFMFYLIFKYIGLSETQQRSALNWGIIGAIILRGLFITTGCYLVAQYQWLLYIFAAFLIYSGGKIFLTNENEEETPSAFIEKVNHLFPAFGTMLLTIIVIEITDIMFAMDSIPAILSITQNSFLVLSSNLFAILGLRSLYFVMLGLIKQFTYLSYCVGLILMFIGIKMLIKPWFEISTVTSLLFILFMITDGILLSSIKTNKR